MKQTSIFLDIVGDCPRMRILQYLIEGRNFDYTLTDLTNAGVSWGTLHTEFPKLLSYGIVVKVREVGRAKLYKIDKSNPVAKKLIEFYDFLMQKELAVVKTKTREKPIAAV